MIGVIQTKPIKRIGGATTYNLLIEFTVGFIRLNPPIKKIFNLGVPILSNNANHSL